MSRIDKRMLARDIKAGVQEQLKDIPNVEKRWNYFTGQYDEIKQPRRVLKHA